jgi:serine protease Do
LFDPRNPRGGEKGKEERQRSKPTLGINARTLTPDLARLQGLEGVRGAYITSVEPESIADEYNLMAEDLIVEMNNRPVQSLDDFQRMCRELKAGDDVVIRVLRKERGALRRSWIVSFTMP